MTAKPTAPGLGVTVDWDAVAEHPPERVAFNLFTEGWERRGSAPARGRPPTAAGDAGHGPRPAG